MKGKGWMTKVSRIIEFPKRSAVENLMPAVAVIDGNNGTRSSAIVFPCRKRPPTGVTTGDVGCTTTIVNTTVGSCNHGRSNLGMHGNVAVKQAALELPIVSSRILGPVVSQHIVGGAVVEQPIYEHFPNNTPNGSQYCNGSDAVHPLMDHQMMDQHHQYMESQMITPTYMEPQFVEQRVLPQPVLEQVDQPVAPQFGAQAEPQSEPSVEQQDEPTTTNAASEPAEQNNDEKATSARRERNGSKLAF